MDMETHRWARRQPLSKNHSPVHSSPEHTFVTETGSSETQVQACEGTGKQADPKRLLRCVAEVYKARKSFVGSWKFSAAKLLMRRWRRIFQLHISDRTTNAASELIGDATRIGRAASTSCM